MLGKFEQALPKQDRLTAQNTSAHINLRTSSPYLLVHITTSVCQIMLHRELLPLLPIRASRPAAPYDPPSDSSSGYMSDAYEYWSRSMTTSINAAQTIMDLLRTTQEWRVTAETPIVGFAVYLSAFMGVYCINLPWMDESSIFSRTDGTFDTLEGLRLAVQFLAELRPRMSMANGWIRTLYNLHSFYAMIRQEAQTQAPTLASQARIDPTVRHMLNRPPSPALQALDRLFRTMGEDDDDIPSPSYSVRQQSAMGTSERSNPASISDNQSHVRRMSEATVQGDQWSTVNNQASQGLSGHAQTPASGQFRSYRAYQNHSPTISQPAQHQSADDFRSAPNERSQSSVPTNNMQAPSQTHGWTTQNSHTQPHEPLPGIAAYARTDGQMQPPASRTPYTPVRTNEREQDATLCRKRILDSPPTVSLSGDDLCAFVEGVEYRTWARRSAMSRPRFAGDEGVGWLSLVWGFTEPGRTR